VNFAVEAILHAILKMTDGSVEQTNASMNLIGAGADLPTKLKAVLKVVVQQFDPKIKDLALGEISKRYKQKKAFIDESLKHLYGNDGDKLIYWNGDEVENSK
jgi:hypothetical protein